MSKATEDWNDIVENTENTHQSRINNPNKNDNTDRTDRTDRTIKPGRTDKTDKPDKPDKPDKTDKTDKSETITQNTYRKKYYPHIPCWFLVNNYQCKQTECWFNHNSELVKEHKLKRERKVCHLYVKCDKRCNKFHNMDELMELYNSANNKLETISSIMKS